MSVNLSARQFSQPDLVKQIVSALRSENMDPADLKLEITESVLMEHPESAMPKLRGLRELGVRIGIITVPAHAAQAVCDQLIDAGVLAIWNFAPVRLVVPEGILVQNENMASSLAILSNHLAEKMSLRH